MPICTLHGVTGQEQTLRGQQLGIQQNDQLWTNANTDERVFCDVLLGHDAELLTAKSYCRPCNRDHRIMVYEDIHMYLLYTV